MHVSRLPIVLCCLAAIACGRSSPAPPVVTPPSGNETINGSERIGWDQRAADTAELAAIGYVLYVDGTRTPLTAVTCAAAAADAGFACSARLPALSAGSHTLQLASFITDGTVLESERSAALSVTVAPQTNAAAPPRTTAKPPSPLTWNGALVETRDHETLRVELVADGLEEPTDLAFAPDGRLLVAERAGTIRILPRAPDPAAPGDASGASAPDPALSLADDGVGDGTALLALALDPQFARTRFVFVIYTAPSRSSEPMFTLARFRESSNTLADRIVLLDGVPAAPASPAAALRFGADGKLYAAFDDGGDPRRSGDPRLAERQDRAAQSGGDHAGRSGGFDARVCRGLPIARRLRLGSATGARHPVGRRPRGRRVKSARRRAGPCRARRRNAGRCARHVTRCPRRASLRRWRSTAEVSSLRLPAACSSPRTRGGTCCASLAIVSKRSFRTASGACARSPSHRTAPSTSPTRPPSDGSCPTRDSAVGGHESHESHERHERHEKRNSTLRPEQVATLRSRPRVHHGDTESTEFGAQAA